MKRIVMVTGCLLASALLGACSNETDGGRRTGGDPAEGAGDACETTTDCPTGQACLVVDGVGACALSCTAGGNECSGEAGCEGVGMVEADFCQPPAPSEEDPEMPPQPEEEPRLACTTDADCAALAPGAVCALHLGMRGCTVRCTARAECNPPPVAGFATDFYDCIPDEGDPSRTVCLVDEACLDATDPLACVTIDTTPPGDDPMVPDVPDL